MSDLIAPLAQPVLAQTVEFGEVAAWGLIAAGLVYAIGARRLPQEGAAVLAGAAALVTKLALLPLV